MHMLYALVVADVIMMVTVALTYSALPPQLPLFYTRPWGEDQLADLWMLSLIPILMHGSFLLNNWLAKRYFPRDLFMTRLLGWVNWFLLVSYTGIFLRTTLLIT